MRAPTAAYPGASPGAVWAGQRRPQAQGGGGGKPEHTIAEPVRLCVKLNGTEVTTCHHAPPVRCCPAGPLGG